MAFSTKLPLAKAVVDQFLNIKPIQGICQVSLKLHFRLLARLKNLVKSVFSSKLITTVESFFYHLGSRFYEQCLAKRQRLSFQSNLYNQCLRGEKYTVQLRWNKIFWSQTMKWKVRLWEEFLAAWEVCINNKRIYRQLTSGLMELAKTFAPRPGHWNEFPNTLKVCALEWIFVFVFKNAFVWIQTL